MVKNREKEQQDIVPSWPACQLWQNVVFSLVQGFLLAFTRPGWARKHEDVFKILLVGVETLSLWEQGGVPRPGTNIPVLGDDSLSHAEEKKRSDVKDNRKAFSTPCASRTPAELPQGWKWATGCMGSAEKTARLHKSDAKPGLYFWSPLCVSDTCRAAWSAQSLVPQLPARRSRRGARERSRAFSLSQQD